MIPLTERLLNDAGGWQAMKAARAIAAAGRVREAEWEEPWLRGRVREGEMEFRSGLKVLSKSNIENLCTCRMSRQHGAICPHSLAVGLAWLNPALGSAEKMAMTEPVAEAGNAGILRSRNGVAFSTQYSDGEKVAVILAPNLEKAFERGGVTMGIEFQAGAKPVLVSALPAASEQVCSASDAAILAYLLTLTGGDLPGMLSLNRPQFLGLLKAAAGHGRVMIGRDRRVEVRANAARVKLDARELPEGELRLSLHLPKGAALLADGGAAWLFRDGSVFEPVAPELPAAYSAIFGGEVVIPADAAAGFFARGAPMLARHFDFESPAGAAIPAPRTAAIVPAEFVLKLEGSLNHLGAKLEAGDGHELTARGSQPRNRTEREALTRLTAAGFDGPNAQNEWTLKGEPKILRFFASVLPALERAWTVTIGSRFTNISEGLDRLEPRFEVRGSGQDWFELSVDLVSQSGERFSAAELRRLLNSGQPSVRLRNNRKLALSPDLLDEFEHVLRDCNPQQRQPGTYRFDRRDGDYIAAFAHDTGATLNDPKNVTQPRGAGTAPEIEFGALDSVLRDYQKAGARWMNQLSANGVSGILADEMGLGKTVQALAWLRHLPGQSLVICPSTLVWNWRREAERFTPELAALTLDGADRRERFQSIENHRLVVTSYALLRRDLEFFRQRRFAAVVLDEAQHIKNPDSQVAQAAFALNADRRLALSGTPIENSVRDIWSAMNFLMPGYLGSRRDFKERFESPIAAQPGGPEHRRLVRRLRPFILRRTKKEVAKELPDKIEQVLDVELTGAQKAAYASFAKGAQERVADLLRSKGSGAGAGRMAALTALLRLRQICLDMRLLGGVPGKSEPSGEEDPSAGESAKLTLLAELISEAVADEHRVLVFSQFAGMLRLIREMLDREGVGFAYLDGSTRDRQGEVDRFQSGSVPVFLISLKAGGVGLNLTAADAVIHFDPWWNPAVEAQATDRAHRIGQTKVVNVYKLIARDTVEEKILALQQKKKGLAADLLESDEPAMQGLSDEDLRELLG